MVATMMSNNQWSWWSEVSSKKEELTLAFITFTVITLAISWYISGKYTSRLPPGPRGLPVVGYLPFLGSNLHHDFNKMAHHYGSIFMLKLGSKIHIVVNSSELAKAVVREHDESFSNRDPPLAGLVLTYGGRDIVWSDNNPHWRNMRKVLVSEVLNVKNLEASRTFRLVEARKTIKHVYESTGKEIDVGEIAFLTSLSIVTSVLWGKSLVEEENASNLGVELRELICRILELVGSPNVSDFFPVLARFDLQGVEGEMRRQMKQVDRIFESMIEKRIKSNAIGTEEAVERQGRKDFLQILLELRERNDASSFNIIQIKALLLDMVFGGTDTTSTMAEWTMAELLKNHEVMKKAQDELEEIVGLDHIVEEYHLSKLHYLEAVVKETFRLHPALPLLLPRSPNQSCKVGEYTVPKGSIVYLNLLAIHQDPQQWDNPSEFNPNRFFNNEETSKFDFNGYNSNFLPFGSGRRRCPGVALGEKMLMYLLASLLHSFEWTLPNGDEHDLSDKFTISLKKQKPLILIPSQRLPNKNLYM